MTIILLHVVGLFLFTSIGLVLTQDLQVFPGALFSLFSGSDRNPKTLPPDVESVFVKTADGKRLELWRLPAENGENKKPYIGVAFHGNGGTLQNFFLMQLWFQEMGITSYGFDYRGFGKSSGWPSEKGIYQDSDAVWNYITERERTPPSQIIVLGFSVGSAPAARIATLFQPKLLVLVSPFTCIKDVIKQKLRLFSFLAPFAWYDLPTIDQVRELRDTSLILVHGGKDNVVPINHSEQLEKAYQGRGEVKRLWFPAGDHNMVFYASLHELTPAVTTFLER